MEKKKKKEKKKRKEKKKQFWFFIIFLLRKKRVEPRPKLACMIIVTLAHEFRPLQIMQKVSQPSYPIKANLTITSLIETLGFKASSINQKPVTESIPNSIQKVPIKFKMK